MYFVDLAQIILQCNLFTVCGVDICIQLFSSFYLFYFSLVTKPVYVRKVIKCLKNVNKIVRKSCLQYVVKVNGDLRLEHV